MDDSVKLQILDIISSMQELCPELYDAVEKNNALLFQEFSEDIILGIDAISSILSNDFFEKKLHDFCLSIKDTTIRIRGLFLSDQAYCLKKIEFELIPLIKEAYLIWYFGYISDKPDKLKEYFEKDRFELCGNHYIDESIKNGHYKYDVTFYILAYNKLDYTKSCIKSLLGNIPDGLNYELILLNHGSTDGTKEFFENIRPNKQVDVAVNGCGFYLITRIAEGEFLFNISNDIILTKNSIDNMLKCIRSDDKIAWVVPATPNVSNFQGIPAEYNSYSEMLEFAERNNISDPYRWEQRVRLCNPIDVCRTKVLYSSNMGICQNGVFHSSVPQLFNSFPDDRLALALRRGGYKMMLAKDAYCHHYGSVTIKDDIQQKNEAEYYENGRREFIKKFNVDPWGTGACYDPVFFNRVVGDEQGHKEILGINCGLGSNSLKIKEQIKEYCHNTDVRLLNITDDKKYNDDLSGISDEFLLVVSLDDFKKCLSRQFDYIVWEPPFLKGCKFAELINNCMRSLSKNGSLIIKLSNQSEKYVVQHFSKRQMLGNGWVMIHKENRN